MLLGQVRTVLCLAARIGTEVKAFLDLGCFAIGIDLNPGTDNRYVVHGDFHDLQFAPKLSGRGLHEFNRPLPSTSIESRRRSSRS